VTKSVQGRSARYLNSKDAEHIMFVSNIPMMMIKAMMINGIVMQSASYIFISRHQSRIEPCSWLLITRDLPSLD